MTSEFYNIYQKIFLPNNFRLRIIENKKVLEKSQTGWTQTIVPSLPFRNKFLVMNKFLAVKNYTEADFKVS